MKFRWQHLLYDPVNGLEFFDVSSDETTERSPSEAAGCLPDLRADRSSDGFLVDLLDSSVGCGSGGWVGGLRWYLPVLGCL